ncbi:MAG: protein kinase [Stomatobaculum sp.]|nr:protein kinase [Stomatobaculum sp.]
MRYEGNLCPDCFDASYIRGTCRKCGYREEEHPRPDRALDAGTILKDRYIIGRVLGSGGFGVTYKVCDTKGRGICAMKEYAPELFAKRGEDRQSMKILENRFQKGYRKNKERFVEEAVLLQRLQGIDGIVNVYDFFQANNTAYYVMEYLDGPSLSQIVKAAPQPMLLKNAAEVILKVGRAMDRVHRETGMIHADISPDNILVTTDGRIRLIDFGSAKRIMKREAPDEETQLNRKYAPPELYRKEMPKGPYTDVYELAATFYYCLTGENIPKATDRNAGQKYIPLYQMTRTVPRNISDAVDKALVLDYTRRTQTLEAFISGISLSFYREELQPFIQVLSGDMKGALWNIRAEEELVIGRMPNYCQILIRGYSGVVSRQHLRVKFSAADGQFIAEDMGSTNGTYRGGIKLRIGVKYRVPPGTELSLSPNGCRILLGAKTVRIKQ